MLKPWDDEYLNITGEYIEVHQCAEYYIEFENASLCCWRVLFRHDQYCDLPASEHSGTGNLFHNMWLSIGRAAALLRVRMVRNLGGQQNMSRLEPSLTSIIRRLQSTL